MTSPRSCNKNIRYVHMTLTTVFFHCVFACCFFVVVFFIFLLFVCFYFVLFLFGFVICFVMFLSSVLFCFVLFCLSVCFVCLSVCLFVCFRFFCLVSGVPRCFRGSEFIDKGLLIHVTRKLLNYGS